MDIELTILCTEQHLPTPRCRNYKTREAEKKITISFLEATAAEAPVAFTIPEKPYDSKTIELRWFQETLWRQLDWSEIDCRKSGPYPLEELISRLQYEVRHRELHMINEIMTRRTSDYLLIAGALYQKTKEPIYSVCINTSSRYQVGYDVTATQNHSSSSLEYQFNALQRDQAIQKVHSMNDSLKKIAHFSVGILEQITVLLPEAVKFDPQKELRIQKLNTQKNNLLSELSNPNQETIIKIAATIERLDSRGAIHVPAKISVKDLIADIIETYYATCISTGEDSDLLAFANDVLLDRFHDSRKNCRSDFDYSWVSTGKDCVLVIVDLDKGNMSVTNDADNVLKAISQETAKDLAGRKIIYRDSDGRYDGMHWDGRCVEFFNLGKSTEEEALKDLSASFI